MNESNKISFSYLQQLTVAYHNVEKRGLNVDAKKIVILDDSLDNQKNTLLQELADIWHVPLCLRASEQKKDFVNINSSKQLIKLLQILRYEVPKIPPTKQKKEKGIHEYQESTGKLALQILFSKTGDDAILKLLKISELGTLQSRYTRARFFTLPDKTCLYLSAYNVSGTLTGRRSSTKNIFGFGGNGQNFPKHTSNGERFLECLVPRPGNIFLFCDQKSAEDWPVCALSENHVGLNELRAGINRHKNLAAFLFNKAVPAISKDSIEYYLGKKTRHANNYAMQPRRMSMSLIELGKYFEEKVCEILLAKVNQYEPQIKSIFHKHIEREISRNRTLITPFGRERQFLGFRPASNNKAIMGEAYAYIPQSIVGDNTGFALLALSKKDAFIVQEGHDSIAQEVKYDENTLFAALQDIEKAFDREVFFPHNGIRFKIPVEAEIGLSFAAKDKVALKDFSKDSLIEALHELSKKTQKEIDTSQIDIQKLYHQNT